MDQRSQFLIYGRLTCAIYHDDLDTVRYLLNGASGVDRGKTADAIYLAAALKRVDIVSYLKLILGETKENEVFCSIIVGCLPILCIFLEGNLVASDRFPAANIYRPSPHIGNNVDTVLGPPTSEMLFEAILRDRTNIVDYLLERGVSVNVKKSYRGREDYSASIYNDILFFDMAKGSTAMHMAARSGSITIGELLVGKGAFIDEKDVSGRTPLLIAAAFGNTEMAKFLVQKGSDPLTRDESNRNILDIAIDTSYSAFVRYILVSGIPIPSTRLPPPVWLEEAVLSLDLSYAQKLLGFGAWFRKAMFQATYVMFTRGSTKDELLLERDELLSGLYRTLELPSHVSGDQPPDNRRLVFDVLERYQQQLRSLEPTPSNDEAPSPNNMFQKTMQHIRFWLYRCLISHGTCWLKELGLPPLPSRVLDLNSSESKSGVRLHESYENQSGLYVALTHRWEEDSETARTTRLNFEEYKTEIPWQYLSRSFRKAIRIVRSLGLRFLWIDSFCIIQDSEEDKTYQISRMSHIYSRSLLTIVIVEPSHSPAAEISHSLPRVPAVRPPGTIDSRAWALQEQALSRRIISIAPHGGYWDCLTHSASEILPNEIPVEYDKSWKQRDFRIFKEGLILGDLVSSKANFELCMHNAWYRMVTDYSTRSLTDSRDKLRALIGMTDRLSAIKNDEFIFGLWKKTILQDLCWRTMDNTNTLDSVERTPRLIEVSPEFSAPSWSWLSVDRRIVYSPLRSFLSDESSGVSISIKTQNRLELRISGSISLNGRSRAYMDLDAEFKSEAAEFDQSTNNSNAKRPQKLASFCFLDSPEQPGNTCILFHCKGMPDTLILRPTQVTKYRRIGIATLHPDYLHADTQVDLV